MKVEIVPADFKNEWREGQPHEEYHADLTAIGSSRLRRILKSAASFKASFEEVEKPENDIFRFGRAVHMAIFEPNAFKKAYVVAPDFGPMQSSKNREAKAAWMSDLPPQTLVVKQDELTHLSGMMNALIQHKEAYSLLKNGKPEISGYYRHPETGIKCRIRPDFLQFNVMALVDLKTTRDCSMEKFSRSCWDYRYDFQLAMYCDGIKQITGQTVHYPTLIAIEKEPPYEIAVYIADEAMMDRGERDYHRALRKLRECIDKNEWPGYQAGLQNITLPPWAFYNEE